MVGTHYSGFPRGGRFHQVLMDTLLVTTTSDAFLGDVASMQNVALMSQEIRDSLF